MEKEMTSMISMLWYEMMYWYNNDQYGTIIEYLTRLHPELEDEIRRFKDLYTKWVDYDMDCEYNHSERIDPIEYITTKW